MTHSPEPWKTEFWCDGPIQIVDAKQVPVCGYVSSFDGRETPIYSSNENLERIAACVNACARLTNDMLQKVADGKAMLWFSGLVENTTETRQKDDSGKNDA